jgi:hypothetical protein
MSMHTKKAAVAALAAAALGVAVAACGSSGGSASSVVSSGGYTVEHQTNLSSLASNIGLTSSEVSSVAGGTKGSEYEIVFEAVNQNEAQAVTYALSPAQLNDPMNDQVSISRAGNAVIVRGDETAMKAWAQALP